MAEMAALEYEKIKLLFDYTKFHFGLYTSIGTIVVAGYSAKVIHFEEVALCIGMLCIAVAGLAAGTITSTLPECSTLKEFYDKEHGIWLFQRIARHWRGWRGEEWTRIEHIAFWLGIISLVTSIAIAPVAQCFGIVTLG
jgi:hypothetical protein